MAYRLKSGIDTSQKVKTENMLVEGANAGYTSAEIIYRLGQEGLTYRRTNMLRDIRRARAGETGWGPKERQQGMTWYDKVYEPFQVSHGLTPNETTRLWGKAVADSIEALEMDDAGADMWELYKLAFE